MAKNLLNSLGGALEITSNIATALASRNARNVLSTLPDLVKSYLSGKRLYLGKLVWFMLYKRNKEQQSFIHQHQ